MKSGGASHTNPKSSLMYVSVLLFYFVCAATLNPRMIDLFADADGLAEVFVLVLFVAHLNIFWLFGGYYCMLALFTAIERRMRPPAPTPVTHGPAIALLYVTMNDFQERAALSCTRQEYRPSHLFILDDSDDPECRASVDAFAATHRDTATVIRRNDRRGFKGGSINSALRTHVLDFPYFIVVDADSVLPENFAGSLLPYFATDENIGWVQASHAPHPQQNTPFARDLALGILPLWEVYYGPRNRFGNVIFLGHGGMIRYDVWQSIGGFPEIVSEDLGFSTRAAQLGYRGYFAHEVVSYEDFPEEYRQLRRQQTKYTTGMCQYLHRELVPYLSSKEARWFEKMDVILSCGSLFVPTLVLSFMIVFCMFIPLLFGTWQPSTIQFADRDVLTVRTLVLGGGFGALWTWSYFVVTAICTLAPVLGCFSIVARYPRRGTRMFLMSGIPYLSLLVVSTATIVSYAMSGKAVFAVTGDRRRRDTDNAVVRFVEVAIGAAFAAACVLTANVSLMAFALALMFGPVLLHMRWDAPLLRPFLFMPFVLICCGLLLGGTNTAAAQGAAMSVFFFHF
jgi:cellulose synthase/poly-beta-1,6-N-acetylglucosamine synthase-like glycosyltransferase